MSRQTLSTPPGLMKSGPTLHCLACRRQTSPHICRFRHNFGRHSPKSCRIGAHTSAGHSGANSTAEPALHLANTSFPFRSTPAGIPPSLGRLRAMLAGVARIRPNTDARLHPTACPFGNVQQRAPQELARASFRNDGLSRTSLHRWDADRRQPMSRIVLW